MCVFVKAFEHHARNMRLPRTVVTRHPMGRPMGAPGDQDRHDAVISKALELLEEATGPGAAEELDARYRAPQRERYAPSAA